ncbi:MAG: hypothetical protein DHS20C10_13500 [marine bacterium B5-7]|nr:MAG: hypothetical protein DHS20C10_13500 [marine bacterium B5-7]
MILQKDILAWRAVAPWPRLEQVEHDLVLSRALCEMYTLPTVANSLIFRGGTALHKLFCTPAGRFSEDLDFAQKKAEPIGNSINAIRERLDPWLGIPSWKQGQGRFTLKYLFHTETTPIVSRKLKIEINTREHFNVLPFSEKHFRVQNPWFSGESAISTKERKRSIRLLVCHATKEKCRYPYRLTTF